MAVPTHSNIKSTSVENMGVPVLFSIKNVQPLILAAKPAAEVNALQETAPPQASNSSTSVNASVSVSSTTQSVGDLQPKARRTGMLSKAIATGFVVMLVVVVIRFSVPGSKPAGDVANTGKPIDNLVTETTVASVVTGPESSSQSTNAGAEGTRVSSLPISPATSPSLNLGRSENNSAAASSNVPVLPPLLSVSNASDATANSSPTPSSISLQPPVVSQFAPNNSNPSSPSSELQTLEIPASIPMPDLSQRVESTPSDDTQMTQLPEFKQETPDSQNNLNVLETLTPERSLAEFELLFRNATKNPLIPYRPVSAGGHQTVSGQTTSVGSSTIPPTGFAPHNGATQSSTATGPAAYQPLTIPSADAIPPYEMNASNQSLNRYQQRIKQPPKNQPFDAANPETSTVPVPYQPLVNPDTPPANTSGTSYGYPPVQYSPAPNSSTQNTTGQR
ncbi:MAG: hypothetical protein ACK5YR_14120 [Pirellula sp.]|jgi:hypothetical protein